MSPRQTYTHVSVRQRYHRRRVFGHRARHLILISFLYIGLFVLAIGIGYLINLILSGQ